MKAMCCSPLQLLQAVVSVKDSDQMKILQAWLVVSPDVTVTVHGQRASMLLTCVHHQWMVWICGDAGTNL